jgi:3-oxoacyl-[acyl-carrier-protein] synthase II
MAGIATPAAGMPVLVGTKGDFTGITRFWRDGDGPDRATDAAITHSVPAAVPHEIAAALGLGHPRLAFTNACIASANAVVYAARLVQTGAADAVLCGGAYLVDEEVYAKFEVIRAFAHDGMVRPFSRQRSGLLLGDGVAALVVEDAARARARKAEPLARVAGWGMSEDAYHVVRPDPDGAGMALALTRALRSAGRGPGEVDYVNAHGTGTTVNDIAETRAIRQAFGPHADHVPVSSTKGTTGHQLEAAAAVQVVIALLALRRGLIPPTAGYVDPDPRCDLDYVPNTSRQATLRRVVTMSAGFGGVNAALLLERP